MLRLGRYTEDSSQFVAGFQALTLAFDWEDVQTVLLEYLPWT